MGSRGQERFCDKWTWPAHASDYLFPAKYKPGAPMSKDVVAHAIVKARRAFNLPGVNTEAIRSHSGRHRFINDMKVSNVPSEVGMVQARIKDHKTYQAYGRLNEDQVARTLDRNRSLKRTMDSAYRGKK